MYHKPCLCAPACRALSCLATQSQLQLQFHTPFPKFVHARLEDKATRLSFPTSTILSTARTSLDLFGVGVQGRRLRFVIHDSRCPSTLHTVCAPFVVRKNVEASPRSHCVGG
ncbi:hypothetical protein BDW22DRAFT_1355970, partial [Trametopsis cervina]